MQVPTLRTQRAAGILLRPFRGNSTRHRHARANETRPAGVGTGNQSRGPTHVQPFPAAPSADAEQADICVILNPKSGKRQTDIVNRLQAAMARHPGRFELRQVGRGSDPETTAAAAAEDGFATLVAAGGDGTVSAVAGAAVRADRVLGIVPLGTFNYFARGLSLPEEAEAAIDLIASGPVRRVAVGTVNGEIFLNNASLGIYPAVLAQREGIYRRWGRSRLAAHWSVLVAFARFRRPLTLRVVVDGKPIRTRTPLAFIARSAYQLSLFGLDGAEDVAQGRFALFLAPDNTSRWQMLVYAVRLWSRAMERGRDFDYVSGRVIEIETAHSRALVARDGERERMRSPFRFEMQPDALRVIAQPEGG